MALFQSGPVRIPPPPQPPNQPAATAAAPATRMTTAPESFPLCHGDHDGGGAAALTAEAGVADGPAPVDVRANDDGGDDDDDDGVLLALAVVEAASGRSEADAEPPMGRVEEVLVLTTREDVRVADAPPLERLDGGAEEPPAPSPRLHPSSCENLAVS